jgi:hypothetical protein
MGVAFGSVGCLGGGVMVFWVGGREVGRVEINRMLGVGGSGRE